jgi:signal transduction histidine kinase
MDGESETKAPPRVFTAEVALALALTAAVLVESGLDTPEGPNPIVILMTLPLIWRRRYPLPVFGACTMGAVLGGSAPYFGLTAVVIAAYSVSVYSRDGFLALAVLFGTATAVVARYGNSTLPNIPGSAGPFLLLVPVWLVGQQVRARQARADAFEGKAARLEREQETSTRLAIAEERGRIARELHDVVAHSVSVMLVQAGAARHVLATAPEQSREALLAVEASGREAMAELRMLLGLLHEDGDGAALTPQPGVDGIESLVRRVGDAGLPVTLHVEGQPRALPVGLDLTVYRIVQEGLTNALKHGGLARTQVILDYRESELKIEILDEGCTAAVHDGRDGRGHGLVGMQQRVALFGGRLESGPRLERGYAVRAWLPLGILAGE